MIDFLFDRSKDYRNIHTGYFLPKVEIKDYIAVIDGRNFFNQPIQIDEIKYDNIQKITTQQGDDYTTGCLLDFIYFKENYKLISIELLIANCQLQQKLDADPKAIKQINFIRNLERDGNRQMFFIIGEAKQTVLDFSKVTVKVSRFYFVLI